MSEQDILKKKDLFLNQIKRGRLHDAFATIRLLSERQMSWELTDEFNRREQIYRYMLDYALDWADDPHRDSLYDGIINSLLVDFDRITRNAAKVDNSRLYYSTLRTIGSDSIKGVINQYRQQLASSDAYSKAIGQGNLGTESIEAAERNLFLTVWTAFPLADDEKDAIIELLHSQAVPFHVKRMVVSALTLGCMEFFDDASLLILADVYRNSDDERLSLPALVGIVIALYVYRKRPMSGNVVNCLESLRELPNWRSDIKTVFLNLIRTRDTDRITRKLRDEVVPEMMKMQPKITKDFPNGLPDVNDLEENPEWQEMLEKSGIADKIKELTEIQEEGGDILMGTFAHLKSFPFFFEIANWFLPFHPDHSEVEKIGEGADVIAEMIASTPVFCENDKFSFMLAVGSVPPQQRDMMLSQLRAQNINTAELQNASLVLGPQRRGTIVNKYIQDLYRFFNLFRRKSDFNNIFAAEINLAEVDLLVSDLMGDDTLELVGEFYFRHGYYKEAFNVFRLLEDTSIPTSQLYQKLGYCCQKQGNMAEALRYYQQSDLLDSRSTWTLRRIASCLRALGRYDEALDAYRRLDALQPDLFSTVVSIGELMTLTGDYAGALAPLFKAVYIDENNPRPWRSLAWALMMTGDFDRSLSYFKKIMAANPTAVDYLNLGHYYLITRQSKEAINAYKTAIGLSDGGRQFFVENMLADAKQLETYGISGQMINFVIDSVLYSINN